jgi:hypothetical protein
MLLWLVSDERLWGRWRSDRERTMAEWLFDSQTPEEKRALVASMFGKLELAYSRWRCASHFEGRKTARWYKVLAKDSESVMIRSWDNLSCIGRVSSLYHIHFDDASYWITLGRSNMREFFRRVT